MEKREKIEAVVAEIKENLGEDYNVVYSAVKKNNNIEFDAIHIMKEGDNIAPNIYFNIDESVEDIVNHIMKSFSGCTRPDFSVNEKLELSNVYLTVKNAKLNNTNKYDVIVADDLYLQLRYMVSKDIVGIASFTLTDSQVDTLLEEVDSFEQLVSIAMENTNDMFGVVIRPLGEIINEMQVTDEVIPDDVPILCLSNRDKLNGATMVFYPGVLESIHEKIGNFYVISSSIHEVLIMQEKEVSDPFELTEMISEVNQYCVVDTEILSGHPYYFDGEKLSSAGVDATVITATA